MLFDLCVCFCFVVSDGSGKHPPEEKNNECHYFGHKQHTAQKNAVRKKTKKFGRNAPPENKAKHDNDDDDDSRTTIIHNMNITCSVLCIHNRVVLVDNKTTKKVVTISRVPYLGLIWIYGIFVCCLRFIFFRFFLLHSLSRAPALFVFLFFTILQKSDGLDPQTNIFSVCTHFCV